MDMKVNTVKRGGARFASASVLAAFALVTCGSSLASGPGGGGGGGGGGGAILQIAGTWKGQIFFPAPPQMKESVLVLNEDLAGNIKGTVDLGDGIPHGPVTGTARNDGTFQLRMEGAVMNGMVSGTVTCLDGSTGTWLSGGVQERGATGSFSVTSCP